MIYTPYDHGDAPTAPVGNEDEHIIGMELEISSITSGGEEFLDSLVDREFLATEDAPDSDAPAVIEYEAQHDVQYEIILRADAVNTIKGHIEDLEPLTRYVTNHEETSCHIHLNRAYVQDVLGLSQLDIYKAAEAIAPFIYQISGRNSYAWEQWTPSNLQDYDTRDAETILNRLEDVDGVYWKDSGAYNDRYELCNCQNGSTIEIRGFSNYCDFNVNKLHLFIDVVADLIPNLAQAMQGKSYADQPEITFKHVEAFLKDHDLVNCATRHWTGITAALAAKRRAKYDKVISQYQNTAERISRAIQCSNARPYEAAQHLLCAMELNSAVALETLNLKDVKEDAFKMEELLQKWFKNTVWRL